MKFKNWFYTIVILAVVGGVLYTGASISDSLNGIPDNSPQGVYTFNVEQGGTISEIADTLEQDSILNSAAGLEWQSRINTTEPLQIGEYTLMLPAKPLDILEQINKQSRSKAQAVADLANKPTVTVTIREGLSLDVVFSLLEEKGVATQAELAGYAIKPENFDRKKYEFLPEPLNCTYGDVTKCIKYYPEGYLYPDTYSFFENSTPKEVMDKMLSNFNTKVWAKVSSDAADTNFQKIVTMASVIELETGRPRGVTAENKDELREERFLMAGAFYNRIDINRKWQSDVTSVYGYDQKVCQQTIEIENCLYLDDPKVLNNKYNTYAVDSYPIGPVTSPQLETIEAALNPTDNDFIFFVADATGKKYFAETNAGHEENIRKAQEINASLGIEF